MRVARVAIDDTDERLEWRRIGGNPADGRREHLGESIERVRRLAEVLACLAAARTPDVGWKALRGVRQEVLVRLFDRVAACLEGCERIAAHAWPAGFAGEPPPGT